MPSPWRHKPRTQPKLQQTLRRDHPTADHRLLPAHALAGRFQTELVKTGEGVQIGRVEGSVVHVEALRSEEKI